MDDIQGIQILREALNHELTSLSYHQMAPHNTPRHVQMPMKCENSPSCLF